MQEHTAQVFSELGITTEIKTYYPLLSFPVATSLEMLNKDDEHRVDWTAKLKEDVVEGDETSGDANATPPWHAFSGNGTVVGPIVYVNYGRLEDFQALVDLGIDLNGTIALVRYYTNFRGLKVRAAEMFGCAGVLIYSDPKEDGYVRGMTYPAGPWRPESSVQRGSVQFSPVYPGDPLTPGTAATKDAPRINIEDANIPSIPSIPLSYQDALNIFHALEGLGPEANELGSAWIGGLPVTYNIGPSAHKFRLTNHLDYRVTPIWNVVGSITGWDEPEKFVILGNHYDAHTVGGAVDPISGTAPLLEVARALGALLTEGWRPRRTIMLVHFDGN